MVQWCPQTAQHAVCLLGTIFNCGLTHIRFSGECLHCSREATVSRFTSLRHRKYKRIWRYSGSAVLGSWLAGSKIQHCTSFGPHQPTCKVWSRSDEWFSGYADHRLTERRRLLALWLDYDTAIVSETWPNCNHQLKCSNWTLRIS